MKNKLINKTGQGISVNVIIIAAIALIVLVVLIAIFTGRFGIFTGGVKETGTCESMGGSCKSTACPTKQIIGALDCDRDYDGDGTINNQGSPFCCKP